MSSQNRAPQHSTQEQTYRPPRRTISRQAQDWQFPNRNKLGQKSECSVWNAYAYIQASGTVPTEATLAQRTGIRDRRQVRRILARFIASGLMTKGKPIYRSNRLQCVPRTLHWENLLGEPTRASTGEPTRAKSLRVIKSFKRKSDTAKIAVALPKVSIVDVLTTLTRQYDDLTAWALLAWTLRKPRSFHHTSYFLKAAESFFEQFDQPEAVIEAYADKSAYLDGFAEGKITSVAFDHGRWEVRRNSRHPAAATSSTIAADANATGAEVRLTAKQAGGL